MRKYLKINFLLVFGLAYSEISFADSFPISARFFIGSHTISPKDLNEELQLQGMGEVDSVSHIGAEVNGPIFSALDWGIKITKRYAREEEAVPTDSTSYVTRLSQESVTLLLRFPFVKSDKIRADLFAGVGGSNTKFEIESATQDGSLNRSESKDWFATPLATAGGSLAIGSGKFLFVIEGGYESNKVDGFTREDNINSNVEMIDFSGPYVTVGLLVHGLTGTTK